MILKRSVHQAELGVAHFSEVGHSHRLHFQIHDILLLVVVVAVAVFGARHVVYHNEDVAFRNIWTLVVNSMRRNAVRETFFFSGKRILAVNNMKNKRRKCRKGERGSRKETKVGACQI